MVCCLSASLVFVSWLMRSCVRSSPCPPLFVLHFPSTHSPCGHVHVGLLQHSCMVVPWMPDGVRPMRVQLKSLHVIVFGSQHSSLVVPLPLGILSCMPCLWQCILQVGFGGMNLPAHDDPSPPQTPQISFTSPELATPSHPAHDDPSPLHTPQSSISSLFPSGTPHRSRHDVPSPCGMPQTSRQDVPLPKHTPQLSLSLFSPSHTPQSSLRVLFPCGTSQSSRQDVPSPKHTPQLSLSLFSPSHTSQSSLRLFVPPHCPQSSMTTPELGTPSHPAHVELSPSHTLHASLTLFEWATSSHPRHALLPWHTPQLSNWLHTHVPCPSGEVYPSGHVSQLLLDVWSNPSVSTPCPSGQDWSTHDALCVLSRLYCGCAHALQSVPSHPYPGGHSSQFLPCHGVVHVQE